MPRLPYTYIKCDRTNLWPLHSHGNDTQLFSSLNDQPRMVLQAIRYWCKIPYPFQTNSGRIGRKYIVEPPRNARRLLWNWMWMCNHFRKNEHNEQHNDVNHYVERVCLVYVYFLIHISFSKSLQELHRWHNCQGTVHGLLHQLLQCSHFLW